MHDVRVCVRKTREAEMRHTTVQHVGVLHSAPG
jgi:hypothetical protein